MNAMKPMLKPALLASLTAIATAGLMALPIADAQSSPASPALVQSEPAPELVSGLPDFTRLVDRVAPGVVGVQARISRIAMMSTPRNCSPTWKVMSWRDMALLPRTTVND